MFLQLTEEQQNTQEEISSQSTVMPATNTKTVAELTAENAMKTANETKEAFLRLDKFILSQLSDKQKQQYNETTI